ncbi:MAG TPA: DsbC family protein [Thioalkalivibrio sp.]|nr:DsbC family protein [Thioalkalivibrio sp.]
MFKTLTKLLPALILILATLPLSAFAQDVEERLQGLIPGATPDLIKESPVDGLYEVRYGTQIFYASADGQYVLQGNLVEMASRTNLTELSRTAARKTVMDSQDESRMVVYAPEGETKHVITVFTDADCTFCRRMHAEMDELNEEGIKVRYLLFPRAGVDSPSYRKAVGVWCADDRNKAMDEAKLGKDIPTRSCDNPVQAHMQLGEQVGVQGTPAIILEGGEMLPGYRPVNELVAILEQVSKK